MRKLDEIALNVELVLISIIEAVALTFLAEAAIPVFDERFTYTGLFFVLSGLVLIMVFWSQAVLHAVSFIRWPLRMEHMLTYFLAAFLQVVAYSNLEHPVMWFFWWTIFSLLVLLIYLIDLTIIKDMVPTFAGLSGGAPYIAEVLRRHIYELKFLVPLSIIFNVVALALMYFTDVNPSFALGLGMLQLLISLGALFDCVRNFKQRGEMVPTLF